MALSEGPMVTEINDFFVQIAVIHGSLSECTSDYPGMFVRLDNPKIFSYIQKELGLRSIETELVKESGNEEPGNFQIEQIESNSWRS